MHIVLQVVLWFGAAFLFGFAYRAAARKMAKPGAVAGRAKNIGTPDRLFRAGIGVVLLVVAAFTGWGPVLLFASGFCFFQAIFSWCLFNQLTGQNTCPL